MNLADLARQSRSFRRFDESQRIPEKMLIQWIDSARLGPSAANRQPLKYKICTGPACKTIFPHLSWAGYLNEWSGPAPGERPVAYIAILNDTAIAPEAGIDHGIAAQTILLSAAEAGFGGCMLGAIDRSALSKTLRLPPHLDLLLILALGKPAETVQLETALHGQIKYWRNPDGSHHVPKRPLSEILL